MKDQTPAEGKKEGGSRRRHRGSRGSHSSQKQGQQNQQPQTQEKPKKQPAPQKPAQTDGNKPAGEGKEKKSGGRPRWHRRGPRKPGGGSKPTGE